MRYKKIMMLTIILAFLVAVSAVSATENATDDMGYASDIITHGKVTVEDKKNMFKKAGAIVMDSIDDLHQILQKLKWKIF